MVNNDPKRPFYEGFPPLKEGETRQVRYRKIDPEMVYQGDELKEIASLMNTEWQFFKDDFLTGHLHPFSRTWKDYQEAHNRRDWDYQSLNRSTPRKTSADSAFDREALKNPGNAQYKGRVNYFDTKIEEISGLGRTNTYPCVSVLGLTNYIVDYVSKQLKEEEQIKFFTLYPQYAHDFKSGTGKFTILGEEEIKKNE
jgi:hypothetical protein